MSDTFEQLCENLKRIKSEMDLARFHQTKYVQREQKLYREYCVALSRLMDSPDFARSTENRAAPSTEGKEVDDKVSRKN